MPAARTTSLLIGATIRDGVTFRIGPRASACASAQFGPATCNRGATGGGGASGVCWMHCCDPQPTGITGAEQGRAGTATIGAGTTGTTSTGTTGGAHGGFTGAVPGGSRVQQRAVHQVVQGQGRRAPGEDPRPGRIDGRNPAARANRQHAGHNRPEAGGRRQGKGGGHGKHWARFGGRRSFARSRLAPLNRSTRFGNMRRSGNMARGPHATSPKVCRLGRI